MKKLVLLTLAISLLVTTANSQIDKGTIELGWTIASPIIVSQINDNLTKQIVTNCVPKLIDEDVKGTIYELSNCFYKVKGIKVLNKEFLSKLEIDVTTGINAMRNSDYISAVNSLIETIDLALVYLDSDILDTPDKRMGDKVIVGESNKLPESALGDKFYISPYNYLFFLNSNSLISVVENMDEEDYFDISYNDMSFGMHVGFVDMEENIYIEDLNENSEKNKEFKEFISDAMNEMLGSGTIIKSMFSEYNFKCLEYTFAYTDNETYAASMSNIVIVFNKNIMYFIIQYSTSEEFGSMKTGMQDLLNNFYLPGIDDVQNLKPCERNETAEVTLTCYSSNPYDVWCNGFYIERINGKDSYTVDLKSGIELDFYVKQVSGYAFYPTEEHYKFDMTETCKSYKVSFPE